MKLSGLEFTEAELKAMVDSANQNLTRYEEMRAIHIPNDVSPPFHFSAIVPGIEVNSTKLPFRLSPAPAVKRPANLEEVAFWPVRHLAELIRTRQVTSVELTQMYLARLHRYNEKLNFVVTFLDELGLAQAQAAPTPRSPRASTRARCTGSHGARKTSSRSKATKPRGARRRSRTSRSITTPASLKCCARRAPC